MSVIEFQNYSAFYKLKRKQFLVALDNLTLKIENGDFVLLVGPSGSSKTTFLRAIAGLNEYYEGKLTFDGETVKDSAVFEGKISYVTQKLSLYPHLSVFDNLAFPLRNLKIPEEEVIRRVNELSKKARITMLLTRLPSELSVGQRQKIAFCRALIKKPDIILLDEPFSNVDLDTKAQLIGLIKEVKQEIYATFILATHDTGDILNISDKVLELNEGEVVFYGKTRDYLIKTALLETTEAGN